MINSLSYFFAFLGGILPAIFWLWFWLKEDRKRPEPRSLLFGAFLMGALATLPALVAEYAIRGFFIEKSLPLIIAWALIEEVSKFSAAYVAALRKKDNDEPVDSMIYLITAALGFAAFENFLYLLNPAGATDFSQTFITGNLRFLGSTLLHVVASGMIGICLAYVFCEKSHKKIAAGTLGLFAAVVLHTVFNFSILNRGETLLVVFVFVWLGAITLLLFFEKVKKINRSCIY